MVAEICAEVRALQQRRRARRRAPCGRRARLLRARACATSAAGMSCSRRSVAMAVVGGAMRKLTHVD